MKILVINCGSSSLKYQLIDMEGEKVLCKGLCERIGMESSMITHEANGQEGHHARHLPHPHRGIHRGREEDDHRCRQGHRQRL